MYTIKLNSRKLVDGMFKDYFGMDEVQTTMLIRLIDRKNKMEHAEFVAKLDAICSPSQRENKVVDELVATLGITSIEQLPEKLREHESVKSLVSLLHLLTDSGITNAVFDITLMRGFDYYTDIVFELFDTHPENSRSIMGGGRYDGLIALFGVEPVPTVGWALGDVMLQKFLEVHDLLPQLHPETDLYVCIAGGVYDDTQRILASLRSMGLNVAVDMSDRKLGQQHKTADKKGIHYLLVIGEQELKEEQFTLKNLVTGQEEKHGLERIVSIIKDYRQS
jgi:histidyl-tRNA synthetase